MLAKELIIDDIPPLKPTDSCSLALNLMDEYKVSDLAIIENGRLLGMVSESDLLGVEAPGNEVSSINELFVHTSVHELQHVFEVVKIVADHHLTVIPVLDGKGIFLGSISIGHLMAIIAEMPMVSNPGGIIVLELNVNDYSMTEIARMVENNDAKIIGSFITSHPDSTKLQLTLKINKADIQAILKTFERYDYTVTASYDQSGAEEDLKDRFDHLMNYLNM